MENHLDPKLTRWKLHQSWGSRKPDCITKEKQNWKASVALDKNTAPGSIQSLIKTCPNLLVYCDESMTLTAYKSEMNPWLYGERENPRELENIKGLDDTKRDIQAKRSRNSCAERSRNRCVEPYHSRLWRDDFLFAALARMLFSAY